MSDTEPWEPSAQLLEELAMALRTMDSFGHTTWFDCVDRRVVMLTFDPHEELEAPPPGAPEWKRQEHAKAVAIIEDSSRFRPVIATGGLGRLREFVRSLREPALREVLRDAIRGGRGGYRRVRTVLRARGLEHLWFDFEAEADRRLALTWLRSEGILKSSDQRDDEEGG